MSAHFKFLLLIFTLNLYYVQSAKILVTIAFAGKSHTIFYNPLLQELAKRGHEVTVITPFPTGAKIPNFKEIAFETGLGPSNVLNITNMSILERITFFPKVVCKSCKNSLDHPEVQPFIKGEVPVDLIISSSFSGECHLGFLHVYDVPLIQINPLEGLAFQMEIYGNPIEIASVPFQALGYSQEMPLTGRLINFASTIAFKLGYHLYYLPLQEEIMNDYFGPGIDIKDYLYKGSLFLMNTENSLGNSRALSPNVQTVGGMQIVKPKPLPKDLKEWLDNAEHGVIYFSLGSNMRSVDLPVERRNALLAAFAKLKQNVLWKWESETLPGQPKNVRLGKWLPQNDLLAHPKIRAFITHGGLLSSQESVNHGIPLIGIPIMGDQFVNMKKMVWKGLGILMELENITESSMSWALNEIQKSNYKEKAQLASKIFRDQPMSPLDKAVYWTEYVLRHNGAPHLANPARKLSWFQRELFDVYLVILLALSITFWILFKIIKIFLYFLRKLTRKAKTD